MGFRSSADCVLTASLLKNAIGRAGRVRDGTGGRDGGWGCSARVGMG